MVEAEALGDRAGELVRRDDAVLDEGAADELALGAGAGERVVDLVDAGEAEVDDDLAEELRGPAAAARGREAMRGGD